MWGKCASHRNVSGKKIKIDNSKKIKPNHLNRGMLHLNQNRSRVLDDAFLKEISNVFNWHYIDEDSRLNHKGCKSNFSLENKSRIDAKTILKSIAEKKANKLVFAHININSLRSNFELLVDYVKGNIDVIMISETEIDDISKPCRLDRKSLGEGILLYFREDILSNRLKVFM